MLQEVEEQWMFCQLLLPKVPLPCVCIVVLTAVQTAAAFSVLGLSEESPGLLNRVVPVSFPDAFSSKGHKLFVS